MGERPRASGGEVDELGHGPRRVQRPSAGLEVDLIYGIYSSVKTTLELSESLLRRTKAAAAVRGLSMRQFIQSALEEKCRRAGGPAASVEPRGWRKVFGRAKARAVRDVNRVIRRELAKIDLETWK